MKIHTDLYRYNFVHILNNTYTYCMINTHTYIRQSVPGGDFEMSCCGTSVGPRWRNNLKVVGGVPRGALSGPAGCRPSGGSFGTLWQHQCQPDAYKYQLDIRMMHTIHTNTNMHIHIYWHSYTYTIVFNWQYKVYNVLNWQPVCACISMYYHNLHRWLPRVELFYCSLPLWPRRELLCDPKAPVHTWARNNAGGGRPAAAFCSYQVKRT